jgi:hypothetical protein
MFPSASTSAVTQASRMHSSSPVGSRNRGHTSVAQIASASRTVSHAVDSGSSKTPGLAGPTGGDVPAGWPMKRTASSSACESSTGPPSGTVRTCSRRPPNAVLAASAGCGGRSQLNSTRNASTVRDGARLNSSGTHAWPAIGTKSTSQVA